MQRLAGRVALVTGAAGDMLVLPGVVLINPGCDMLGLVLFGDT